jgi:hypothetical protein
MLGAFFLLRKKNRAFRGFRPALRAWPLSAPLQSLARPRGFRVQGFDSWNFAPKK